MTASSTLCWPTSPKRQRGISFPSLALRAGRRLPGRGGRPALTLLEVLIALAIFLLAMVVFGEMIVHNGDVARELQRQNLATRLCQSRLNQVAAGVVPLTSQDDAPCDEDPDYSWSMQAESGAVDGLWNVTVHVTWRQADASAPVDCTLSQMILDPSIEGSTQDATPVTSSTASSTNSTSTGSSTPSTSPSSAPSTGLSTPTTSTPAASKPATSTPTPTPTPKPTPTPTPTTSTPKTPGGK